MTSPTTAPAGWYPDSTQPGTLRWYDGTAWTEHVTPDQTSAAPQRSEPHQSAPQHPAPQQPAWHGQHTTPWQGQYGQSSQQTAWQQSGPWQYAQPTAPDNGPSTAVHWMLPVGRSWQSVVAGYLGLLSLGIWVLGPFAIGFGSWALVRAQHGGHGRGRAITGILGGGIGCVILIAFALNAAG